MSTHRFLGLQKAPRVGEFTLAEAWKGTLYSGNMVLLFFMGEIIGKGKWVGYYPGWEDSPRNKKLRGEISHH